MSRIGYSWWTEFWFKLEMCVRFVQNCVKWFYYKINIFLFWEWTVWLLHSDLTVPGCHAVYDDCVEC